jgi:hypothetical protein
VKKNGAYVMSLSSLCLCISLVFARKGFGKHVSAAARTYATREELLAVVLSVPYVPQTYSLCNERKVDDLFFPELLYYFKNLSRYLSL